MIRLLMFSLGALLAFAAGAAEKPPLPWLGMAFTWAESEARSRGLHVRAVTPGGPAEKAGVRPGDLVVTVNGTPVDFGDELEFLLYLQKRAPGERLRLQLVREGRAVATIVTLGRLPDEARPKWERNLRMARERRAARERPPG
ncbi:MAG TPA: PDZ domain-containing protein [Thermoanaerobaculia bacterium]|jgi:S1-C subfamily serine protease